MSTSSPEQIPAPANPYKAPASAASSFAKSYLTLAVCCSLAAATVFGGIWLYARYASPKDTDQGVVVKEPERAIMRRSGGERHLRERIPGTEVRSRSSDDPFDEHALHSTNPFDVDSREASAATEAGSPLNEDPFGAGEDNPFGGSDPFGDAPADPLDDSPFGGATTYDPFEVTEPSADATTPLAEREDPFGS